MSDAGGSDRLAGAVRGVAAGVPYVALPPPEATERPALVLLWHGFSTPRSEDALAAALPLEGVPAWRAYLGLPMFGHRLPEGGFEEVMRRIAADFLRNVYAPIVEGAVAELPRAHDEIVAALSIDPEAPLGLFGFSAGGAAALLALARGVLPFRAVAAFAPVVDPVPVVEANARFAGEKYPWGDETRALAAQLDLEARAGDVAARGASLLVAFGQDDALVAAEPARRLLSEVRRLRPDLTVEEAIVPGVGHAFVPEPGLFAAPQGDAARRLDAVFTSWFARQLGAQPQH